MKTFDEYQVKCAEFAVYGNEEEENPIYCPEGNRVDSISVMYTAIGLGSEAGEVLGQVNKAIRDDGYLRKTHLLTPERYNACVKELGDCLWYLAQCATELGISLEEVANKNIEKLSDRLNRDTLRGSGDER